MKKTVIVDLDGTLALNAHRAHFIRPKKGQRPDWDGYFLACGDDLPNYPVISAVNALGQAGYAIHIFSARGMIAQGKTIAWLQRYRVQYDRLTLREIGCYTPDEVLKQAWLEQYYPNYRADILCVLDDRNKVVNMWRALGLVCLQVAEGDF